MRVFNARAVRYDPGPNLTSLVDVVMVVLIFLMLAGSFAGLRILPGPAAASARGAVRDANSLDVRVGENPVSHRMVVTAAGVGSYTDVQELLAGLRAKHDSYAAAGIGPETIQIIIRPTGGVSYQHVLTVYETVQRANFRRVAFAATR